MLATATPSCYISGKISVGICLVALCSVKPKQRKVRFVEHEKILQSTVESYITRVHVISMVADKARL